MMMMPIIPPKYDIGFVVENCDLTLRELGTLVFRISIDWVGHKGLYVNKIY